MANQDKITINQEKLDHLLSNQTTIMAAQDAIVENQRKILVRD